MNKPKTLGMKKVYPHNACLTGLNLRSLNFLLCVENVNKCRKIIMNTSLSSCTFKKRMDFFVNGKNGLRKYVPSLFEYKLY